MISVITVVLNGKEYIEKTIQNILEQTFKNIELIIIDGGSSDGTLEIIDKYRNRISCFVSEPDKGIYDAMNKGIKASKGEVINFLNCGDYYYDNNVLNNVYLRFKEDPKIGILYGLAECYFEDTDVRYIAGGKIDYASLWRKVPLFHQAMFYRKEIFSILGEYRTDYRIVSDFEHFFRFLKREKEIGFKAEFVNRPLIRFNNSGTSSKNYLRNLKEFKQLSASYFKMSAFREMFYIFKWLHYFLLMTSIRLGILKYYRTMKYQYFSKRGSKYF